MNITRLLLFGLMTLPLAGWGQIHKWVDEKGVTHYTETPPPSGKSQVIRAQPRSPAADASKPTAKSWQEQDIEFRQRQVEAEEAKRKQEANASREAALRRACAGARADLENLRLQRPIYRIDERGEKHYIEDKERAELIRKTEWVIERDCPEN